MLRRYGAPKTRTIPIKRGISCCLLIINRYVSPVCTGLSRKKHTKSGAGFRAGAAIYNVWVYNASFFVCLTRGRVGVSHAGGCVSHTRAGVCLTRGRVCVSHAGGCVSTLFRQFDAEGVFPAVGRSEREVQHRIGIGC